MNFNIGDKVKFLNEQGGGVVKGFRDNYLVLVETEDGFELPVAASDLMHDHSSDYERGTSSKADTVAASKKAGTSKPRMSYEEMAFQPFMGLALMAIVPDNPKLLHVSNFKLYLLNDSNYKLNYTVSSSDGRNHILQKTGIAEAKKKIVISAISQSDLSKIKEINLAGIFFKDGYFEKQPIVELNFFIGDISFYKSQHFSDNRYFKTEALLLMPEQPDFTKAVKSLSKGEIEKIAKEKEELSKVERPDRKEKPEIAEVDLHIEEIVDDHSQMSNGQILETQMSRFETALETAINAKTPKIVFIHGVGNGRLKMELIKKLDRKYGHLKYQDASFKEYGYGATMVYLK